jgi:hypothetical protein
MKNGGRGMSDEEVKSYVHTFSSFAAGSALLVLTRRLAQIHVHLLYRFIDRYIPGYIFFASGIEGSYQYRSQDGEDNSTKSDSNWVPPWSGNGLRLILDWDRELQSVEVF